MSSQTSGIPIDKAEVRSESLREVPMDLAPRGPVVQLHPTVRAYNTLPAHSGITAKSVGSPQIATVGPQSIISVNRSTPNLTLLPARGGQPVGAPVQAISAYQITRVGNVRPGAINLGNQPTGSITVTPITGSNANFRLTGATVNNGSWIQTSSPGQGSFRAIAVSGRPVRPDAKLIQLPPQSGVQHQITQLKMVDSKGSVLKPQITTTPIMNIRGTLQPQGNTSSGASVTVPIPPFSLRAANITALPTMHTRPPNVSSTSAANTIQKVQISPAAAPIQFVNANKNQHLIQATTSLPRLNTVCLTLSTNATIAPNNTAPVVVASRSGGGPSLMMAPAQIGTSQSGGTLPMKVYPVRAENTGDSPQSSGGTVVAMSAVTVNASGTISSGGTPLSTITNAVMTSTNPIVSSSVHGQSQNMVQLRGPINVQSGPIGIQQHGTSTPYYLEKNVNVSVLQTGQHPHSQIRPVTLVEKRSDGKSIPSGSMILTTHHPQGTPTSVPTLTMAAHQVNISQSISVSHHSSASNNSSHPQIFTSLPSHLQQSSLSTGGGPTVVATPLSHLHQVSNTTSHSIQLSSQASNTLGSSNSSSSSFPTTAVNLVTNTSGNSSSTCVVTVVSTSLATVTTTSSNTNNNSSLSQSTVCTNNNGSSSVSTTAPVQSPNQKSTHSPRPSILRKREMNDHGPSRAQRNLSLSLNYAGNNSVNNATASAAKAVAAAKDTNCDRVISGNISSSSSSSAVTPVTSNHTVLGGTVMALNSVGLNQTATPAAVTAVVSCSSSSSSCSGISILRKEFQPPNEESSWQSCGSNSSGSTTISATSETAEIQMQNAANNGLVDLSQEIREFSTTPSSTYQFTSSNSSTIPHNGMLRSASAAVHHGKSNRTLGGKAQSKDIDRLKARAKDDCVSPRKKPRKQLLTSSELLESDSPELSLFQGKRQKREFDTQCYDEHEDRMKFEPLADEPPTPNIVYYLKKPRVSLLKFNKHVMKGRHNHFERYSDIKAKEDKRPSVSELANQKNIHQKVNGTKMQLLAKQMVLVMEEETDLVSTFNSYLGQLDKIKSSASLERDLNQVQELLKGNMQRCKVIHDQISECRSQLLKVLDHKPRMLDIINKYNNNNKRPIKKRERL